MASTTPKAAHLPIGRINTIMKSSSDVENVGKDSVILMSKAAELFIRKLVVDSFNCMRQNDPSGKTLKYQNLATVVQNSNKYHFLKDMTPMKITVREYKRIMARKNGKCDDEEEEEDEETVEVSSDSGSDEEGSVMSSRSSRSVISVPSD